MVTLRTNLYQNFKTKVLWENSDITAAFAPQTIQLTESVLGFDVLFIQFLMWPFSSSDTNELTRTDLMLFPKVGSTLHIQYCTGSNNRKGSRQIICTSPGELAISSGLYNGSATSNTYGVPTRILGMSLGFRPVGGASD